MGMIRPTASHNAPLITLNHQHMGIKQRGLEPLKIQQTCLIFKQIPFHSFSCSHFVILAATTLCWVHIVAVSLKACDKHRSPHQIYIFQAFILDRYCSRETRLDTLRMHDEVIHLCSFNHFIPNHMFGGLHRQSLIFSKVSELLKCWCSLLFWVVHSVNILGQSEIETIEEYATQLSTLCVRLHVFFTQLMWLSARFMVNYSLEIACWARIYLYIVANFSRWSSIRKLWIAFFS